MIKTKFMFISLFCFFLPAVSIGENTWTETITPEITLEAIQIFRENPSSDDARKALTLIVNFAKEFPDVSVKISSAYLPWDQGALVQYLEGLFLGAYVAGNIEYQLIHKIKENRPLEGIRLMLFCYQVLRDREKIEPLDKFDDWLDLDQNDKLQKELNL